MKKKWLAVMLAAVMAISAVGCGASNDGGGENPEQTKEESGAGTTGSAGGEDSQATQDSSGEVESLALTVWSPSEDQDPEYGQWLITMCEKFNELHPEWDITFTYGVCTESDAKKLVPQDIDAAADVFLYSSTGIENLCQANCLTELGGKYLEKVQESYSDVLVDCLTFDGGVYGVPMTTNTFFMYYDKSVFSEEDVTSLEAMLEKGKVALPLTDGFYLSSFYLGAGCSFFGPEGKDRETGIVLNGDNAVAMTDYLVDAVQNSNVVVASPDEAIAMMREGDVNAYMCGTWQAAQTEEILGENFGVAPLPSVLLNGVETQLRPFSSAKAIGVKSTTQYPAVAIELALYLGGYDSQKAHYEMRNYVPCFKELLEDEEIKKDEVVMIDAYSIDNISVPRANFTEMSYFWSPAESFGTEIRDGAITHENSAEKTAAFHESANSSGVE